MAKHSKPTRTSALSKTGARGAAALAIASVGFLATAPAALAGGEASESSESQGIGNVADNNAQVPVQACNNYVPVNVLGVQVPLEDIAGNIPIVAESNSAAETGDESCEQVTPHLRMCGTQPVTSVSP